MHTKKMVNPIELETGWIDSERAVSILSKRHERPISDAYVRRLAGMGIITAKKKKEGGRENLYWQEDVETCEIKKQGDGSVRRATRGKKADRV